ncbi:hypothetical protein [Nocardia gamkensis]|uniref:hypothetical protein n=1 Tax=Nocardia gamkensis TaxID=352869 RepID=UPI0037CBA9FE
MPSIPKFKWLDEAPEWVREYYRSRIEIELRSVGSESFQKLFDRMMRCIHGPDYQETSALGSRGDYGCDGYLKSRMILFACYGPTPYFKLDQATKKLRKDLDRAIECWDRDSQIAEFVFVFNYPGKHAALIQEAAKLEEEKGLKVSLWSRVDIVEQFLLMSERSRLIQHFGEAPVSVAKRGRSFVIHEASALPRAETDVLFRAVRARITCDRPTIEKLHKKWFELFSADPVACLVAGIHGLVCAIGAYVNAEFEPEYIDEEMVAYESGLSQELWEEHGRRTWLFGLNAIWGASGEVYTDDVDPIGEDMEKLIGTAACCELLIAAMARMYAREGGYFETDCLDRIWKLANEIIVHPD